MSVANYSVTQTRGGRVSCPKNTPEGSPHQVHGGTKIGAGTWANESETPGHYRVCVHNDPEGEDIPVAVKDVPIESIRLGGEAATTYAAGQPAPVPVDPCPAPDPVVP